jgi:hypothetical protein
MLEGNFRDVSLPGLLQFLATEINKSYRVKVTSSNHVGEIFVCKGAVTASSYGLLEGEDALCEFLSWKEGSFGVELLNSQIEIKKNLQFQIQPTATFADQSAFLNEQNVGLNSMLVASKAFGTAEWQETIKQQPLERDDFMVLGWFGQGRTMRQALREFNFDIVKATGVIFRLVATKSILVLRPGSKDGQEPGIEPDDGTVSPATIQRFLTTGGQEAAAACVAHEAARILAQEANAAVAQDAFVSTSFKSDQIPRPITPPPALHPKVDMAQVRASMEARLRARSGRASSTNSAFSSDQVHDLTAQTTTGPQRAIAGPVHNAQPAQISNVSANTQSQGTVNPPPSAVTLPPVPLRELLTSQAESKKALEEAIIALNDYSDYSKRGEPAPTPPVVSEPNIPAAKIQNVDIGLAKTVPPLIVNNAFAKLVTDEAELAALDEASRLKTATLPLVSMDIERLLVATFKQTQFGKLALTNPSLDHLRRQTLLDVEAGKSLTGVMGEGNRPPAAVLSSYRYCLDRGYIESADPVVSLTADLLLGRVELDQYLLQRRRITGDELRELTGMARKQGEKLSELFLRNGYVTPEDLDTLNREQRRFAFK